MKKNIIFLILFAMSITASAQMILGADTGWNTEMEAKGHKFYNWKGEAKECTEVMRDMGFSAIRIRVWVDPSKHEGWCGKDDVLEKALRAKRLGMDVMIDFHYSDWWADPAKQNIPAAWEKHSYKKMLQDLAAHTRDILQMLKDNGVEVRWVQVGNETRNGLLWSVECDPVTGWERKDENGNTIITKTMGHWQHNPEQYAGFLRAGYDAVKSVMPETAVIIHIDNGFDADLFKRHFTYLREQGVKWDIIGMSLYPYWAISAGHEPTADRTITDGINNIKRITKTFGTPVMIVETGYEVDEKRPWVMTQGRDQLSKLIRLCQTECEGKCLGIFYWEPECRPAQYKLGAFTNDGHPTDIMRAITTAAIEMGNTKAIYDRPLLTLPTTMGDIRLELYNETPVHRDNFLRLMNGRLLESTLFHRVIKDFMIQGGDPDSRQAPPTSLEQPAPELGNSDILTPSGERSIEAEILYPQFYHRRGTLAAAREADEDNPQKRSSSSQFYIVYGRWPASKGKHPYVEFHPYYEADSCPGCPWLDGGYTVFGEVISGMDVVESIMNLPTDSLNRPLQDVRIK